MTQSEAKAALKRSWSLAPVRRLRLLGAGDSYWAFLLNGAWVCRVARTAAARRGLHREVVLLPWLAAQLPLPISAPHTTGQDEQNRLLFAAYPFLPGPSLSPVRYRRLDATSRARCAAQLGQFLARLHAVDPTTGPADGGPAFGLNTLATFLWTNARRALYLAAAGPEQRFLARVLNQDNGISGGDLAIHDGPAIQPSVWLHGDLSHDHVLFDPVAGAVSAILDFGDLRQGDPAWDLVFLYRDYGPDFIAQLLRTYNPPDPAALLRRVYYGYQLAVLDGACDAARSGSMARAESTVRRLCRREDAQCRTLWTACGLG